MNKTSMCFDLPGNHTTDTCEAKTVTVKTTDDERNFTTIFVCMADSTKLHCAKQRVTCACNTALAVFPGNLNSILQPLDVSLIYLFKCRV